MNAKNTDTEKKNGTTAPDDGYEDWVPTALVRADGFWNANEQNVGKTMSGILLAEVRMKQGKPLDNPFYIFRLTAPCEAWVKDENDPTKGELVTLEAGKNIGVGAAAALSGAMQKVGYGFHITYEGKIKHPRDAKKTLHTFKFRTSKAALVHVEKNGDNGSPSGNVEGDSEIPF